jgi:hypothetical protein
VQVRLGQHVERVLSNLPGIVREGIRHNAVALDQTRVTVGRLASSDAAVDQHHIASAPLQVQRC